MPVSSRSLEQRVASYTIEATQDPISFRAMKAAVEAVSTHGLDPHAGTRPNSFQRRGAVLTTGITEAVLAITPAMKGDVTAGAILRKLEQARFQFAAVDRKKTVSDALQRLHRAKKVVLVRKGVAGKGNVYRAPQRAGTGTEKTH